MNLTDASTTEITIVVGVAVTVVVGILNWFLYRPTERLRAYFGDARRRTSRTNEL
jgi:hypothetical protein